MALNLYMIDLQGRLKENKLSIKYHNLLLNKRIMNKIFKNIKSFFTKKRFFNKHFILISLCLLF